MLHENIKHLMRGFRYDAHPMGVFLSTVGALSTFYPDAKKIGDAEARLLQCERLIAKTPTVAAYAYRHSTGRFYVYPDNELSFAGNFLNMLFKMTEAKYRVNPVLERALEVLFILHADHEQNCGTNAMRAIGSSQADPVLVDGRRRGGALRSAARRRQRSRGARCSSRSARSPTSRPSSRRSRTAKAGSWGSATASTSRTTRARASSRRPPTKCSR